jgi:hypothetical protein
MSQDLGRGGRGDEDSNQTTGKHFGNFANQDGGHTYNEREILRDRKEPQAAQPNTLPMNIAYSSTETHSQTAPIDSNTRGQRSKSTAEQTGAHGKQHDDWIDELSSIASLPACIAVPRYLDLLQNGPLDPPVTTESLRELDLPLIKNNLSLRIDVNYDHDLHFMPITGRRGDEKRGEAHKYWQCVVIELCAFQHDARRSCSRCNGKVVAMRVSFPLRLPNMFHHIRALVLLLVPDDDHPQVREAFDVDLLVQEMQNSVLDAGSLAIWLKALLTTHCAPIRDDKAEEMANMISRAEKAGHMDTLALGLEKLFAFLESMRLDVANHQISECIKFLGPTTNDYEERIAFRSLKTALPFKLTTSRLVSSNGNLSSMAHGSGFLTNEPSSAVQRNVLCQAEIY